MGRTAAAGEVIRRLSAVIPRPETELIHQDPYQLLVAVILSAPWTDARVNEVTPALFRAPQKAEVVDPSTCSKPSTAEASVGCVMSAWATWLTAA